MRIADKNFIESTKIKLFDGEYSYSKSLFGNNEETGKFVKGLEAEFLVTKISGKEINKTSCNRARMW